MPAYRCYLLNWSDQIACVDSLHAEGDAMAMAMAAGLLREQRLTSAAMEVWNQKRCVGRVDNDGSNARTLRAMLAVKSA